MAEKKLFSSNPPLNHIKVLDGGQGWIGLLNHMGEEITICNSARVSFDSMKDSFDDKDEKLLKYLIKTSISRHLSTCSLHSLFIVRFLFAVNGCGIECGLTMKYHVVTRM